MNKLDPKMSGISFAINTKDQAAVYQHLLNCDEEFLVQLAARTSVKDYASKIVAAAVRFEALDAGILVGLVACYLNKPETKEGYITNVSLVNGYTGMGIAYQLMQNTIAYAADHRFDKIKLEVEANNRPALSLYRKCRFEEVEKRNGFILLEKKI